MSLIKVNSIEAYTGTSISVMSNILFKDITTGTSVSFLGVDATGKIISGSTGGSDLVVNSISATSYLGLPTDITVTGGTYSNGTAEFTNNTGGTFSVTGFTVSGLSTTDTYVTGGTLTNGTAQFTNSTGGTFSVTGFSSSNISDSIYTVNNNLNANNTSIATTSVMSYGVNVFTGVTATNYATKLPQPVTGKSVKVVNNGNTLLSIYPSNIGGQINNLPINMPAQIPPDGKLYEFICIVNPLPGAWTFTPPATAQYDSGEISFAPVAGSGYLGYNPIIVASDSTHVGKTQDYTAGFWGDDGKNKPLILESNAGGYKYLSFRPTTPWQGISKIKVYTNIINDLNDSTEIRLIGAGEADFYSPFDGSQLGRSYFNTDSELFRFNLDKKISGVAVSAGTIYTSANIGDAGTKWNEYVANTDTYSTVNLGLYGPSTLIGNQSLGTVQYPYPDTTDASGNYISSLDDVELYYSSYISFRLLPLPLISYSTLSDLKFRFIIEYYT